MALPSPPSAYYITTSGNDLGTGAEADPFLTLEKARDTIRGLSAIPTGGTKVYVKEGDYFLASALTFDVQDSGADNSRRVSWESYPGHKANVNIFGAQDITDHWALVSAGDSVYSRIPASSVASVYYTDLPLRHGISDYGSQFDNYDVFDPYTIDNEPMPMELYNKGHRQHLARYPNVEGDINSGDWRHVWQLYASATGGTRLNWFGDRPNDRNYQSDDSNDNRLMVFSCFNTDWAVGFSIVSAIYPSLGYLRVQRVAHYNDGFHSNDPSRWFIFNCVEELDYPGEYWIDKSTGRIYWYPEDPIGTTEVFVTLTDQLVYASGTQYMDWKLPLQMCRDTALTMYDTHQCKLTAEVRNAGRHGVDAQHYQHGINLSPTLEVTGHIWNTGGSGLQIGGGKNFDQLLSGSRVYNFEVNNWGFYAFTRLAAALLSKSTISNPEYNFGLNYDNIYIHDGPGNAVRMYGAELHCKYMRIDNVCTDVGDASVFYKGLDWFSRRQTIEWCVITDCKQKYIQLDRDFNREVPEYVDGVAHPGVSAFYYDDGSLGYYIKGCVVDGTDRGIMSNRGKLNYITQCVFSQYTFGGNVNTRWFSGAKDYLQDVIIPRRHPFYLWLSGTRDWEGEDFWNPGITYKAQMSAFRSSSACQGLVDDPTNDEWSVHDVTRDMIFEPILYEKSIRSDASCFTVYAYGNYLNKVSTVQENWLVYVSAKFLDRDNGDYRLADDSPAFDSGQMNPTFDADWNENIAKAGLVGYHATGDVNWLVKPPLTPQLVDSYTGITGILIEFKEFNGVSESATTDTLYFFNCHNIILENIYLGNAQKVALHFVDCSNIKTRNVMIETTGLGANAAEQYAIIIEGSNTGDNIDLSGIYLTDCDGNILLKDLDGVDNTAIRNNFSDKLTRRNTGGNDLQYVRLQNCTNMTNFTGEGNILYAPLTDGGTEIDDIFTLDGSSGTLASPLHITNNRIYGSDPTTTDKAAIRLNALAYAHARHNIILDQKHAGVLLEAGRGHEAIGNSVYASRLFPQHAGGFGGIAIARSSTVNPGSMYDAAMYANSNYGFRDDGAGGVELVPLAFASTGADDCTPNHGYCAAQTCDCALTSDPDNWDMGLDGNTTTVNNEASYDASSGFAGYTLLWDDDYSTLPYAGLNGYGGIPTQATPAHGAGDASLTDDLTLAWENRASTVVESFSLVATISQALVSTTTSATSSTLVINPDSDLAKGVDYTGHVVGATYDSDGEIYQINYEWSFLTGDTRLVDSSKHRHTAELVNLTAIAGTVTVALDAKDSHHSHTTGVIAVPPPPPTGVITKVFASTVVLDTAGFFTSNGSFSSMDNPMTEAKQQGYTRAVFELTTGLTSFTATPSKGARIRIYERNYMSDGIALSPVPDADNPRRLLATIPVDLVTTQQVFRVSNLPISHHGGKYYLRWNDGEGGSGSMYGGWAATLTPYSLGLNG